MKEKAEYQIHIENNEFIITTTEETDFSPDGGYTFLDHTCGIALDLEEAAELRSKLTKFIGEGKDEGPL